jgi:hypothetical protein
MGTAERGTRQSGRGTCRRAWGSDAAVRADECALGAWDEPVSWEHPAAVWNRRRHGPDHGQPRRLFRLALASGRRNYRRADGHDHRLSIAWQPVSAQQLQGGRRSLSGLAKWITCSTRGRPPMSCSSPSRGCLRAAPRELTSRIPVRARDSDDLTERRVDEPRNHPPLGEDTSLPAR